MHHIYIPQIVYAVWCIFWAYANAKAIKSDSPILHGINGLVHFSVCIYFGVAIHFLVGLTMFFMGRPLFDGFLNLFRFGPKGIGYVPANPKSIFDKAEKSIFGNNGITPKLIYLGISIALIVTQLFVL